MCMKYKRVNNIIVATLQVRVFFLCYETAFVVPHNGPMIVWVNINYHRRCDFLDRHSLSVGHLSTIPFGIPPQPVTSFPY